MANVYRANIISIEPAANGTVQADCFVELRGGTVQEPTWTVTSNGHFTIVLTAQEVLEITNNASLTNIQKRHALKDIIKARALERGVDQADEAYAGIVGLVTLPLEVIIR